MQREVFGDDYQDEDEAPFGHRDDRQSGRNDPFGAFGRSPFDEIERLMNQEMRG